MGAERQTASAESEIVIALDRVGDELRVLRDVLDEIRSDLQWAVRNGRVVLQSEGSQSDTPTIAPQITTVLTLFNEGDAVEFIHGGDPAFGEVVEVDDGRNVAQVMLIPSCETVLVQQDELRKVEPDELARLPQDKVVVGEPVGEIPEPGNLF